MPYHIDAAMWSGVFAVPVRIVDEHIKLCGASSLKALLVILRSGGQASANEVAQALGLSSADVTDALNYWISLGVIAESEERSAAQSVSQPDAQPETSGCASAAQEKRDPLERESLESAAAHRAPLRRRLTTRQINEMSYSDENIAHLLQEAQSVLGKPLTPVATDTVAALYSYYGMAPDLILMLLQYCVSRGKDSMRYVEKVAAGWIEAGIDSHEKAEAEILRAVRRDKAESKIQRLFGIGDRALVTSEREYIRRWVEELGYTTELIGLAYERTVEQKGKLSFAYLNAILQNWHAKGVKTPRQASEECQAGKRRPEKELSVGKGASYDMTELERLIT